MNRTILSVSAFCLIVSPVLADQRVDREKKTDVVLRALVDELERGRTGLELQDLERPYFMEYALLDSASGHVLAKLGAITRKNSSHTRRLRTDIRVGSYELDNTNFSGGYGGFNFGGMFGGGFGSATVPIEDDYNAIRQALWWSADRKYKSVVEAIAQKRAFMESKIIEDKPNDFSRESTTVHFENRSIPRVNLTKLETLAIGVSKVFREFADVKDSSVSIQTGKGNKYLVNTEGTRLRTASEHTGISISATVQADDGMELTDSISVYVASPSELPSIAELSKRSKEMVDRLIASKNAPKLENYTGPVLFEPRAAASLFSSQLARKFSGGQRALGGRTNPNDFANKLDKRILPRFISIVDDPTQKEIANVPVTGHYTYDDQGVKARRVDLVENGKLRALVMSRNPSKEFDKSTGHGRGLFQPRSSTACITVTAKPASDMKRLKEGLIESCSDEDLPYGIRIAALGPATSRFGMPRLPFGFSFGGFGGMGGFGGVTPVTMYKVFPDGREELVRGAEIARVDLKAFKRILAAGDEQYVMNSGGYDGRTVTTPAMLFEELDLAKIDQDFDKPPIIPSPLARATN